MHQQLAVSDPELRVNVPDTRDLLDYHGPALFISYAFDDHPLIERLTAVLRARKRRYFLLESALQGTGATARENSVQAVKQADAILIVVSVSYQERFKEKPEGNIANEIYTMFERVGDLPIAFASPDTRDAIQNALPWSKLAMDEGPLIESLRDADDEGVAAVVDRVLRRIDERLHDPS